MKKFDIHIHASNMEANTERLIEKMTKADMYGGVIFSNHPTEINMPNGTDYESRISGVFNWVRNYKDRLFPVLWIHPYEKDIKSKITDSVERGIKGFKIICTDFYVYERTCMNVLEHIAMVNKPVFFHSGILWDGRNSSNYNRPLNWESLIDIEELRFSLAHCSWPWYDECIALYGKFLNALSNKGSTEMFFDLTPGTPVIYREDLLFKLFHVGYDVADNIMFGTDSCADEYKPEWVDKWLSTDEEIYMKFGVSEKIKTKIYHDNIMRFLGKAMFK